MTVFIDLTEFLRNPILTGIQRVTAEICRWWPNGDLRPVKLSKSGHLVELPHALIGAIARSFSSRSATHEIGAISKTNVATVALDGSEIILVPEVFYDPQRIAFFRTITPPNVARYRFIVYDLMPLLHPEYFAPDVPHDIVSGYFLMLRRFPHCGFISESTQSLYCRRLLRTNETRGTVLRLGSDGLGAKPSASADVRKLHFCAVGTIEPRKNHAMILDVFDSLLKTVTGARLTFLGRMGWVNAAFSERLRQLTADCPSFNWISDATDDCIKQYVESARATLYVSAAEGYGLPPLESLWLGTPSIVSPGLPSLENHHGGGIDVVNPLNATSLKQTVSRFFDDSYAAAKVRQTRDLELPTWQSFARAVADWCSI